MSSKKYIGRYVPARDKWASQRTKLERASDIAQGMRKSYYAMWPGTVWPCGHCFNTSLILAPIIRSAIEWDVRVVVGRAGEDQPHAWIETPGNDIVDPTYGQFDGGPALRILPVSDKAALGHRKILTLALAQEQRAFAALKPLSSESCWAEGSGVLELFGDNPFSSPLAHG